MVRRCLDLCQANFSTEWKVAPATSCGWERANTRVTKSKKEATEDTRLRDLLLFPCSLPVGLSNGTQGRANSLNASRSTRRAGRDWGKAAKETVLFPIRTCREVDRVAGASGSTIANGEGPQPVDQDLLSFRINHRSCELAAGSEGV